MKKILSALTLICCLTSTFAQTKLMTYNIKYANETDGENSWSYRKDWITNQIKFYEPDIFGVQEALHTQIAYFDEQMPNYKYIGVGRDNGKQEGEYSAIFYNTNKLEVLKSNTFWLNENPTEIKKGWDAVLPRICTYGLFENKESGEKFWHFNAHFDHVGVKARQESAKLIFNKIQELNTEDYPVVLTGDLNLTPETKSIQYLSDKMLDAKSVAELAFGPTGTYNGFNFSEPVITKLDYVFVSKNGFKVKKHAVLSDSKDLHYPSDHLPVMVILE
ncbi:endonuclease/exonuclease/phosphatase family protein [Zunongwangia endophytica]|uniref:Endonuclease/exonuclease/phosphatase family protein n=1 Tax=Zunongwangia endophytica TaxID=1808945 RepID=A0ABV8HE13_9FLAO|nr:endonuclease/exonuclease/phosphatase family protein [Zunongwangia endophytica]MDN3596646.1 endonuclease/exonuclease/phosphatase family protein [Zunongwangia endophytica]